MLEEKFLIVIGVEESDLQTCETEEFGKLKHRVDRALYWKREEEHVRRGMVH